ncbi:hypothetical protein Ms3S1_16710 [Methylosinus sp. 3S-1]
MATGGHSTGNRRPFPDARSFDRNPFRARTLGAAEGGNGLQAIYSKIILPRAAAGVLEIWRGGGAFDDRVTLAP